MATVFILSINSKIGNTKGSAKTENIVLLLFDLSDKREMKLKITLKPKLPRASEVMNKLQFSMPLEANNSKTTASVKAKIKSRMKL